MNSIGSSWASYPKVYSLGHRMISDIDKEFSQLIVQEKIDGSQISFGMIDGQLMMRSRNKVQDVNFPDKMFSKAAEVIKGLADKLTPGYTYRGEYLQTPKHNVLHYSRIPINHIIIFDINIGLQQYMPYLSLAVECDKLGLECVPHYDVITDPNFYITLEYLEQFLSVESCLGGCNIEGVVVKNYDKFGVDGKVMMGKFVSEIFKESHKSTVKKLSKGNVLDQFKDRFVTEARWMKAVQHLKETGELEGSPKDIGALIKEVFTDFDEEEIENVQEFLYSHFQKEFRRVLTHGLPEWYKKLLIENNPVKD